MASTIGIKTANGEFYSLLEENSHVKKRLVLTTANDNQTSVQIDLYKSRAQTMGDAVYVGSLVVEKIKPRPKRDPSIEMVISSTKNGDINAEAVDLDSKGAHCYLSVSLKTLSSTSLDSDTPDFELESGEIPPTGLYERAAAIRKKEQQSNFPTAVVVVAVIVGLIVLIAAIWYFFFLEADFLGKLRERNSIDLTKYYIMLEELDAMSRARMAVPAAADPSESEAASAEDRHQTAETPVLLQEPVSRFMPGSIILGRIRIWNPVPVTSGTAICILPKSLCQAI